MYTMDELRAVDPEIAACIDAEAERQNSHIELIASENWVSHAVMAAMGSILTNKYAEGYPGKRYYGGCVNVDTVEQLAIDRAKELFGCEYANVQPHSGAQANMAVQFAMLARAILSWFPMDSNKFTDFLYTVTEPFIYPVRMLFEKMNWFSGLPIDMSFLVSYILLSVITTVLQLL